MRHNKNYGKKKVSKIIAFFLAKKNTTMPTKLTINFKHFGSNKKYILCVECKVENVLHQRKNFTKLKKNNGKKTTITKNFIAKNFSKRKKRMTKKMAFKKKL